MNTYIIESGMKFGPLSTEALIPVEQVAKDRKVQEGQRMTEFIYYNKEKHHLYSIEAKTSAPSPESAPTKKSQHPFQDYITEIKEKFENSLDFYLNILLRNEAPSEFQGIDYQTITIIFILVIKNHKDEWLEPIKNAIEPKIRAVHRLNKLWHCKVLVLNEAKARCHQLIQAQQEQ